MILPQPKGCQLVALDKFPAGGFGKGNRAAAELGDSRSTLRYVGNDGKNGFVGITEAASSIYDIILPPFESYTAARSIVISEFTALLAE